MKMRLGFVTNSSSSSFILSFKDENSIYETLKKEFPKNIKNGWSAGDEGYLEKLFNEIQEADKLTLNDVKELVKEEDYNIYWQIIKELTSSKKMSYSEISDFLETNEGKHILDKAYEKEIETILQRIGDDKIIVEVEHGDGGMGEDGVLEYDILPKLSCTIASFSHH